MNQATEQTLNLFVSSPGDVQAERSRIDLVVERLNGEFAGRVRIRAIRWETSFYSSHETFQKQIPEAAACDLVIAIFGARLGSPLPKRFPPMPSGEPYPSGTAYEVLTAMEARRQGVGVPDIYVFRRPNAPLVALDARDREEIEAQWKRLTGFFETWFRNRSGEFLAAFQEFSSTDEFASKIEDCLRQWLARRGFSAQGPVWDRVLRGSPFPGLAAFDEARQSVFFGRGLVVDQAIGRLRQVESGVGEGDRAPFLLLIGASGSGKSSVLRAGLLPRLVLPGVFPEIDLWRRAIVTPGPDPFLSLAEALYAPDALGPELALGSFRAKEILAKQLAGDPDVAIAPLRDALERAAIRRQSEENFDAPRLARLILAIDQAERLLIETDAATAAGFALLLATLARQRLATIVMALRSDAYARFQGLAPLVGLRDGGATLDLLPPNAAELEEMTTRPVALCEPPLAFEQKHGRSLAATLVADARGGDALPLLQMTLSRLSAAEAARGDGVLRFADYRGMDAAVTETANEALATLDAEARAQLPALVTGLVRDIAADPLTGALSPIIGALDRQAFELARPERKVLVDAFVAKRLLTSEGDAASRRVRPTHEALLRIWPEAVAIIAEAANLIRVRHTLEPIVRDWVEAADDDKARHLDISPALLEGAQRYIERYGAEAPRPTRDFVAASTAVAAARRDHERQEQELRLADAQAIAAANKRIARRSGIGLVAALALAGLAGWQWRTADLARRDAQAQRDRAETNLKLATETANGLIFDIAQKFRSVAGMQASIVKDILDRARGLQDQLLNAGETTPALKASQGAALGETALTMRSLGDSKTGMALARQARDIFAALILSAPTNAKYRYNLASSDLFIGDILADQGDVDGAVAAFQRSLDSARAAAALGADNVEMLRSPSSALDRIGDVEKQRGNFPAALKAYKDSADAAQTLIARNPANVELRNNLAVADRHVGDVLLAQNNLTDAAAAFTAATKISEQLTRENPNDTRLQRDLSVSDERLGESMAAQGDQAGALKAYQDGEDIAIALAKLDPTNWPQQDDLLLGYSEIGATQLSLGAISGAIQSYREAVAIGQKLIAQDASNAGWRQHCWSAYIGLGDALVRDKEQTAALAAYRDGASVAKSVLDRDNTDAAWRRNASVSDNKIGDILFAMADFDNALVWYRDGLSLARALLDEKPEETGALDDLSVSLAKLGGVLAAKGQYAEALASLVETRNIRVRLVAREPNNALWRGELAVNLETAGGIQMVNGDFDAALKSFREAVALTAVLTEDSNPTTDRNKWREELALAQQRVGDALGLKGDVAGSLDAYRQAVASAQPLIQRDNPDVQARRDAARADFKIGAVLAGQRDLAGALAAYRDDETNMLALVRNNPKDPALRGDLATAQEAIGRTLRGQGDFAAALDEWRQASTLRDSLANEDVRAVAQRLEQTADLDQIGDALKALHDSAGALAAYQDALARGRTLATAEAANAEAQSQYFASANSVGDALAAQDDAAGAESAFREGLAALAILIKLEPRTPLWRSDQWLTCEKLGNLSLKQGDRAGALATFIVERDAAVALIRLDKANKVYPGALKSSVDKIGFVANAMLRAHEFDAALAALDQAVPVAPDQNWLDLIRAACLMFQDHDEEARALFLKHRGEISFGGQKWEAVIKGSFAGLRQAGMPHPLMDEIERQFSESQ